MADYRSMNGLIDEKIVRNVKDNYPGRKWTQQELKAYIEEHDPVKRQTKNTARYEFDYVNARHPELFESPSKKAAHRWEMDRSYSEWRDNTGGVRDNTIRNYRLEGYHTEFTRTKGLRIWKEGWKRRISLNELEQRRVAGRKSAANRKRGSTTLK